MVDVEKNIIYLAILLRVAFVTGNVIYSVQNVRALVAGMSSMNVVRYAKVMVRLLAAGVMEKAGCLQRMWKKHLPKFANTAKDIGSYHIKTARVKAVRTVKMEKWSASHATAMVLSSLRKNQNTGTAVIVVIKEYKSAKYALAMVTEMSL